MDSNSKFLQITGQVVKRIFNPENKTEEGKVWYKDYLVLKWATGASGEWIDYLPIVVKEPKLIKDIREGYVVTVNVMIKCPLKKGQTEVQYDTSTYQEITSKRPLLWPTFQLSKTEIIINDSSVNWEQHAQTNMDFEKTVIPQEPEPEDDLPF